MNNNTAPTNNVHAEPAQKVGGMRVKNPDSRRRSLVDETAMKDKEEDGENTEESNHARILEERQTQERQAQDMQAHTASRQPDISKNAGSNVKDIYISNTQPNSMNH